MIFHNSSIFKPLNLLDNKNNNQIHEKQLLKTLEYYYVSQHGGIPNRII